MEFKNENYYHFFNDNNKMLKHLYKKRTQSFSQRKKCFFPLCLMEGIYNSDSLFSPKEKCFCEKHKYLLLEGNSPIEDSSNFSSEGEGDTESEFSYFEPEENSSIDEKNFSLINEDALTQNSPSLAQSQPLKSAKEKSLSKVGKDRGRYSSIDCDEESIHSPSPPPKKRYRECLKCKKDASYGYPSDNKRIYCSKHKKMGMISLTKRK